MESAARSGPYLTSLSVGVSVTACPVVVTSYQELENVLWALCRLEHRADDLVAAMALEASG